MLVAPGYVTRLINATTSLAGKQSVTHDVSSDGMPGTTDCRKEAGSGADPIAKSMELSIDYLTTRVGLTGARRRDGNEARAGDDILGWRRSKNDRRLPSVQP
ncbi:hypothetical protein J2X65_004128 [Ancylobacter sp. 3268]|uniref:hypothetical protein n=1 Tax=Ancylobacter sp. 3268 TaxID=2817752 RepID=UPI0028546A35|nr:hypothetical protein [Ancylobacter sp. 3268]MDR6954752.1 hypothetical protein [Ancylobacter sp. 3268]